MIGIIGVNGEVGTLCYKLLVNSGLGGIIGGVRNKQLLNEDDINYKYIDLMDKRSCFDFVKRCDFVINCATANHKGIYNLVEAVEFCGKILFDLTYYEGFKLPKVSNASIYHGIGLSPGLTEALPKIMLEKFDSIIHFDLYYVAMDIFSYSAAKSYLEYIESVDIYPMTEIKDGRLQAVSSNEKAIQFNIIQKELEKIPYMDSRSISTCERLGIENARYSICIPYGETYKFLMEREKYKKGLDYKIGKLVEASMIDRQLYPLDSFIIADINGVYEKKERKSCVVIKSSSSLKITVDVVISVLVLVKKTQLHCGIYDITDLNNLGTLLDIMSSIDPELYINIFDDKSVFEIIQSEGEI